LYNNNRETPLSFQMRNANDINGASFVRLAILAFFIVLFVRMTARRVRKWREMHQQRRSSRIEDDSTLNALDTHVIREYHSMARQEMAKEIHDMQKVQQQVRMQLQALKSSVRQIQESRPPPITLVAKDD
jgi:uncharacterized membrane protein YhiD involved in acid resistance